MPNVIHHALFEKLARHPEWLAFHKHFAVLSGYEVELEEFPDPGADNWVKVDVHGVAVGYLHLRGTPKRPDEDSPPGAGKSQAQARREAARHVIVLAAERFSSLLAAGITHTHDRMPASIVAVCRWIRARVRLQEIRLPEVAKAHHLSPSHLSRLFRASTGLTFQEYVTRLRLEYACELLRSTGHPVTTIAFESGFQSISQFNRSFKAIHGMSPREFRRAGNGGNR